MKGHPAFLLPLVALPLACAGEGSTDVNDAPMLASTYTFENADGESTVSYSGQVARHELVLLLKDFIGSLSDGIADGSYLPGSASSVETDLDLYFECDAGLCEGLSVGDGETLQQFLGEVSSGKNLVGKLAGNDDVTDHRDWDGGAFAGWAGVDSPESLVRSWFHTLAVQSVAQVNGTYATSPEGSIIEQAYLTPEGLDLQQLIQKFLLGAIAFSQGTDDYLDDDVEGKGLLSSHLLADGKAFTGLEHSWDEAFGYFGASRNYAQLSDVEIADGICMEMNSDGLVDLVSEVSRAHSVNAAKRDKGASVEDPTDFTALAWEGFVSGRQLLSETAGEELSADDFSALVGFRDQAVLAWEYSISATVVHYINDVLSDMDAFEDEDYSFPSHAKHWSELKGFALGLQFNPHSLLGDADFETFHALVGDAPVLAVAGASEISDYKEDLLAARQILGTAYGFDTSNLGDDRGENGW